MMTISEETPYNQKIICLLAPAADDHGLTNLNIKYATDFDALQNLSEAPIEMTPQNHNPTYLIG